MNKNRVVKNASWIIGIQIVKSLLGLVISMLTARFLGPSNFGLINYAAAIGAFVVFIFSDYSTVFLTKVNRFLLSHNIDNRIIVKFLESNLLDDSGRGTIIAELQTAIKEKPIFGYGIMGDRIV